MRFDTRNNPAANALSTTRPLPAIQPAGIHPGVFQISFNSAAGNCVGSSILESARLDQLT